MNEGAHTTTTDRRAVLIGQIRQETGIDEEMIERLVHGFYARVREDDEIGPIFNAKIRDWGPHLQRMCEFWSSVALMSGRYHGQPMVKHLPLPVDGRHFDRWLALFEATARELCPPSAAAHFGQLARRIAESLELGIASARGVLLRKGERYLADGQADEEDIDGCGERPLDVPDTFTAVRCKPMMSNPCGNAPALVAETVRARRLAAPPAELSSPVCYAGEFEREANRAVIARLDELLEAERAGARVTLETARQAPNAELRELVMAVHRDEVKWCVMLGRAIRSLDATPGSRTGAFYEKAMAVADVEQRLAFLNRGQGWVVRKIRELLPLVNNAAIEQDLNRMLVSHEVNIEKVNDLGLGPATT